MDIQEKRENVEKMDCLDWMENLDSMAYPECLVEMEPQEKKENVEMRAHLVSLDSLENPEIWLDLDHLETLDCLESMDCLETPDYQDWRENVEKRENQAHHPLDCLE